MRKELIHIIEHSLGDYTCYRNHFATSNGSKDYENIQELVDRGLMEHYRTDDESGLKFFRVTNKGKKRAFISDMRRRLIEIAKVIEGVDDRCMAFDGDIPPTLDEMTQEEISKIYALATGK